jgi:hypothetical protein
MAAPQALIDKLSTLPSARLAEVEDFVDFLRVREQDRLSSRTASLASEPAFAKVWSNPDDDVYDAL